jgi:hypothetical protein
MGYKYICPDCQEATDIPPEYEIEVVMVNGGGVYRDHICPRHNRQMKMEAEATETEWVGDREGPNNYEIVE